MRVSFCVLCILLIGTITMADQVEQTDWSSGGGVSGPVMQWSDQFSSSYGIGFAAPGILSLMVSATNSTQHTIASGLSLPDAVFPCDIDGDGDEDVFGAFWNANKVLWFENANGTGTWWNQHTIDTSLNGPRDVFAADLDGDGDPDLLGAIHAANRLVWWENINNGSSWVSHTIDGYLLSCTNVRAVDMDNDGDLDALASGVNVSGDLVVWWENENGATTWTEHIITTDPFYPRGLQPADLDGDGDMDVAVGAWNDSEISWWENPLNDGSVWLKHSVDNDFGSPYTVYCADLDGDGDEDIIAGASQDTEISWWENQSGDGSSWLKHSIDPNVASSHFITAADMNNDGHLDVLSSSYSDNTLAWYENRGGASSWIKQTVSSTYQGADHVRVGDFDGNGTLDMVGAAYLGGHIDWFEIVQFGDSGELTSSILDTNNPTLIWDDWALNSSLPTGTELSVEVRASNDPDNLGAWVPLQEGELGDYLENGSRYLQYRILMNTSDAGKSPLVQSINFSWTNSSATPAHSGTLQMLAPYPNPSSSAFNVSYNLVKPGKVELSVYDLAGRLVEVIVSEHQSSGSHNVNWNGSKFSAGVYLLRLSVEGEVITRRAMVSQ